MRRTVPLRPPTGGDLLLGRPHEFLTRRIHRRDLDRIEIFPGFRIGAPVAVLVPATDQHRGRAVKPGFAHMRRDIMN